MGVINEPSDEVDGPKVSPSPTSWDVFAAAFGELPYVTALEIETNPKKWPREKLKNTNLVWFIFGKPKTRVSWKYRVLKICCFSLAWRCCLMIFTTFYIFCVNLWKLAVWQLFFLDAGSITTPRRKTAEVLCPCIFWVQDAIVESEGLKQGIPYPKECTACNHSGGDCLMGWEEHSNLQFLFCSFVRQYETSGGVEEGWLFIWV